MTATTQNTEGYQGELKPVRVVFRQLDYLTEVINPLGQKVDGVKTAYGPGHPELNPSRHPEIDPDSQEYADLVSDFQRGQLINLREYQYVGLIRTGAVRDVKYEGDDNVEVDEDEELIDVGSASVDELADWIRQVPPNKPTVQDVVNASGGDPDIAKKLLEAESKAHDGEPRKGVLEGLTAVVSRG